MNEHYSEDGTSVGVDLDIPDIFLTDTKEEAESKINGYISEALARLERFKDPSKVKEGEYAPHVNVRVAIDTHGVSRQGKEGLHARVVAVFNYTLSILQHHEARLVDANLYSAQFNQNTGHLNVGFRISITPEEDYHRIGPVVADGIDAVEANPSLMGFTPPQPRAIH